MRVVDTTETVSREPSETEITDEYMQAQLARTKPYTFVLLRRTPKRAERGSDQIVWEHGRRNFELRASGKLPIVCPLTDGSEWAGIGIFDATPEEVRRILEDDPAVRAGIFTYEIHPVRGFPGATLPA